MPRVTPVRVIRVLLLPWVALIGLWLFLPSPTISSTSRNHYVETILQSGEKLTTVHEISNLFSQPQDARSHRSVPDDCSGLVIDWRLVSQHDYDSVSLQIGDHLTINLTDALLKTQTDAQGEFKPYLSKPFRLSARVGDQDHFINMPWFHWPDQVLFHNQMHGFNFDFDLRVYVPEPRVVEVWKDTPLLKQFPNAQLRDAGRAFGILATFSNLETFKSVRSNITRIRVSNIKGRLLSNTYTIRSWILVPLAPILMIVGFTLIFTVLPFAVSLLPATAVYVLLIWIMWLIRGRPEPGEWLSSYWMTRWLFGCCRGRRERKGQIWGPGGPVYISDESFHDLGRRGLLDQASTGSMAGRFNTSLFGTTKSAVWPGEKFGFDYERS